MMRNYRRSTHPYRQRAHTWSSPTRREHHGHCTRSWLDPPDRRSVEHASSAACGNADPHGSLGSTRNCQSHGARNLGCGQHAATAQCLSAPHRRCNLAHCNRRGRRRDAPRRGRRSGDRRGRHIDPGGRGRPGGHRRPSCCRRRWGHRGGGRLHLCRCRRRYHSCCCGCCCGCRCSCRCRTGIDSKIRHGDRTAARRPIAKTQLAK